MNNYREGKIWALFVITVIVCIGIFSYFLTTGKILNNKIGGNNEEIANHLKLKTTKDKIYKFEEIDEKSCQDKFNCTKTGNKLIKYYYIKDKADTKRKFFGKIKNNNELLGAGEDNVILDEINRDYDNITYGTYGTSTNVTEFFNGIQFVKNIETGEWFELETPATTTSVIWDLENKISFQNKILSFLKIGSANVDTTTFYPDPNVETNTVDGWVCEYYVAGTNLYTWAQILAAAGNLSGDTDANMYVLGASIVGRATEERRKANQPQMIIF